MMNRQTQNVVVAVFLFVAVGVVASLMYFLFIEAPFLTYKNLPFPPQVNKVRAGEIIPVVVERCNASTRPRTYNTTHAVENVATGDTYILGSNTVPIRPGCTKSVSLANKLPSEVPPGRYRAFGTAEVRGTIRSYQVDWFSQEFEVVK